MTLATILLAIGLAFALSAVGYLLNRSIDVEFADEGYLWYGVQRTLEGEVPIRDFRAYDPGRYHWCAFWMRRFGAGLTQLRLAVTLFGAVGLAFGVMTLLLAGTSPWLWIPMALLLHVWMQPRHKQFEHAIVLTVVFSAALLLVDTGLPTAAWAGLVVGLALYFGLNHGLYAFVSLASLAGYAAAVTGGAGEGVLLLALFLLGAIAGSSPFWFGFLRNSSLWSAYLHRKIRPIVQRGHTNLPLPVPWPWRVIGRRLRPRVVLAQSLIGFLFLALPLTYLAALGFFVTGGVETIAAHPVPFAAAIVGACYSHHAFSRADLPHLSQAIHPLLITLLSGAAFSVWLQAGVVLLLLAVSTFIAPRRAWVQYVRNPRGYRKVELSTDSLWLRREDAEFLATVEKLLAVDGAHRTDLMAAPVLAGLYAIFERVSPVYDTFPVYPGSPEREREMLRSLQQSDVRIVVIKDVAIDGRPALRFSQSYPEVWHYLAENFAPVATELASPTIRVLQRRRPSAE